VIPQIQVLRPNQWIKNLLLFVAPFTSESITNTKNIIIVSLGFLIFCAASSLTYLLNDWVDRASDATHSRKSARPFASGSLNKNSFLLLMIILICIQVISATFMPEQFTFWILLYLTLTTTYSLVLKKVAVIEMFIVSIGFIFRALAGAASIGVEVSIWFLVVTGFGSLFLVSSKRLAEKKYQTSTTTREIITQYPESFLRMFTGSSLSVTLVGYTLWAFQGDSQNNFSKLSVVVFSMLLFRYLWIAENENTEEPEIILFKDPVLVILQFLLLSLIVATYYG
jgi:decaprenyl-phosphate phosphoribosyltransferase